MAKLIQIFKAGRRTATNGKTVNFSEADIAGMARAYRPGVHEAPVVIGHPKSDDPALGWTKALHARGGDLFASVDQLDLSFAEGVRAGKWKKVSASFYEPDSKNNPCPGTYYLRHIGFLGAQPPAVKGLEAVNFAEGDTAELCLTLEFAEGEVSVGGDAAVTAAETADKVAAEASTSLTAVVIDTVSKLLEGALKAAFPELDSAKLTEAITAALATPPEGEDKGTQIQAAIQQALIASVEAPVKDAVTEAAAAATTAAGEAAASATLDHSEPNRMADHALRRRQADLDARERRLRRTEHETFLAQVAQSGKRLPFQRAVALEYFEQLSSGTLSFAEGRPTALELTKQLVNALPVAVDFSERSGGAGDSDDPVAIARSAQSYQAAETAKGNHVTTSEAVRHVKGAR